MVWFLLVAASAAAGYYGYAVLNKNKKSEESEEEKSLSSYRHGAEPQAPKKGPVPKNLRYNPLSLTKNGRVTIADGDLSGILFVVSGVESFSEEIDGRLHPFTDYLLVSQTAESENPLAATDDGRVYIRLRVIRQEHDVLGAPPEFLVYYLHESKPFDKAWIQSAILNAQGEFRLAGVMPDEPEAVFRSCDNTSEPHSAKCTQFRDDNGDGVLAEDEARVSDWEYWAFQREVSYEGEDFTQYCLVQVNLGTGNTDILIGWPVTPAVVQVA